MNWYVFLDALSWIIGTPKYLPRYFVVAIPKPSLSCCLTCQPTFLEKKIRFVTADFFSKAPAKQIKNGLYSIRMIQWCFTKKNKIIYKSEVGRLARDLLYPTGLASWYKEQSFYTKHKNIRLYFFNFNLLKCEHIKTKTKNKNFKILKSLKLDNHKL